MKLRVKANGAVMFRCPGCECVHRLNTTWQISGTPESPTIRPSVLVTQWDKGTCHSFVTDGQIQFLDDCGHALKGQTVPLPEYAPDEYELADEASR